MTNFADYIEDHERREVASGDSTFAGRYGSVLLREIARMRYMAIPDSEDVTYAILSCSFCHELQVQPLHELISRFLHGA